MIFLNEVTITFGKKIEYRRKELGYTQAEFVKKIQASQSYVSRLENDAFNPSMPMIINVAIALNISIDYLLLDKKEVTL